MSFIIYDITFLVLSILIVGIFFYKKRKNFTIEGPLYLYRTKIGLQYIEKISKKYKSLLKSLQYLILISGYALMVFSLWFIIKLAYIYITSPYLAKALKVPVIFPLIPYLPSLFKLDFLPPFYFTYWIIIIAIIALPHEFAHGIYARFHKMKLHSTGFGFLRIFKFPTPFLAAFVEPDEKQMQKMKKFPQLVMIAAGTFANVVVGILFLLVMWIFMIAFFTPAGLYFNAYATQPIPLTDITGINNMPFQSAEQITSLGKTSPIIIQVHNQTFIAKSLIYDGSVLEGLEVYEHAPAFKSNLTGAIQFIDGDKVTSYESLRTSLAHHQPGDTIHVQTTDGKTTKEYILTLDNKNGKAYLGIGIIPPQYSGLFGWFAKLGSKVQDPLVYYQSNLGDFGIFIKELFWWIVIVSFSVALMNMLPLGIFDGGKFFYLSIWALTGKEKIGQRAYQISTWLILALFAALMVKWVFAII